LGGDPGDGGGPRGSLAVDPVDGARLLRQLSLPTLVVGDLIDWTGRSLGSSISQKSPNMMFKNKKY
jgi:hypothetical protein